jgi:hypothetical protein
MALRLTGCVSSSLGTPHCNPQQHHQMRITGSHDETPNFWQRRQSGFYLLDSNPHRKAKNVNMCAQSIQTCFRTQIPGSI